MQKSQKESKPPPKASNPPTKPQEKPQEKPPPPKETDLKKPPTPPISKSLSPHKDSPSGHKLPHEDLDSKIKARKRLLETLEQQTSFCSDETLLQLNSRDSIIEEQNKELVSLRARIKHEKKKESKDKVVKPELQKIAELESEKSAVETKYLVIVDKYRNEISKLEEEKMHFEVMQDTLNEELEVLRSQVKSKDQEIAAVVTDVQKLSEIIQQFKTLNNDLNSKIEKQNSDYEFMAAKYYETEVKAASMAETENALQDYMNSYSRAEMKGNKLFEELRTTQLLYEDLQAFCKFAEEKLEDVQKEVNSDSETAGIVKNLRSELGKKRKIEVVEKEEKKKSEKIRKLNEELERERLRSKQTENEAKPMMEQVKGLQGLVETMKNEHSSTLENLNKALKAQQDFADTYKAEISLLRTELQKRDLKIASLSSKLSASESKSQAFPEKINKLKETLSVLDKENSELKQKVASQKTLISEKQSHITALEKQNTKYILNIQALHEEFWKKDTTLIKAKKALAQLQKSSSAPSSKSPITKTKEGNEKLLKELQEKDQKIELLKEMVKSSHLKKEGRRLSPETSTNDATLEKNSRMTHDLINSLAAKTINKFFTLFSFRKNNPQDSPADMQRQLKKLKQDLKSYTNFAVKELQSSVSYLQHYYFDNKSHITLDELIEAISNVVSQ